MKKTIYFHIGFPKTGTTSLQSFCYKNSKVLEENGLLYPVYENYVDQTVIINARCFRRVIANLAQGQNVKDFVSQNRDLVRKAVQPLWQKMRRQIDKSSAPNILLSCEGFASEEFVLWDFIDWSDFNLKVVVYMRNMYDQMISWYKQRAKDNYLGDYSLDLLEYVTKPSDHSVYHDVINMYGDYFGAENVLVRIYDKSCLKNGNTIDDFFDLVGLQIPKNLPDPIYINTSFSHDTTVICGFTKTIFAAQNYNPGYYPIYELSLGDVGNQKTSQLVPKEIIKEICDKYYAKDCQIAKRFLSRDQLFADRYPKCYYEEFPQDKSAGVEISYQQLDILYEAIGKLHSDKLGFLKILVNALAFLIPSRQARQKFRFKYGRRRFGFYQKLSFKDLSGNLDK